MALSSPYRLVSMAVDLQEWDEAGHLIFEALDYFFDILYMTGPIIKHTLNLWDMILKVTVTKLDL